MSSIWMEAVCAGCGETVEDRATAVAVVPCTTKATWSHASGYPPSKDHLRVMPSKGRKDQQKPLLYHERCWPTVLGHTQPRPKYNPKCPYPNIHAADCDCRGAGGSR